MSDLGTLGFVLFMLITLFLGMLCGYAFGYMKGLEEARRLEDMRDQAAKNGRQK